MAILKALQYSDDVLIEEFLNGIEVSCGVFSKQKNKKEIQTIVALPITEIISKNNF